MKHLLIFILTLAIFYSCAQIKSYPIVNNTITKSGFYYALPKTYLNIAVTIQKKTIKQGAYFEYAKCVGLPEVGEVENKSEYIVKEAVITNNVYLDKSQIYQLDVNQKFLNKSEFSIEYATNGELTSGNISNEDQVLPAIITTVNVIKDIASVAGFGLGENTDGLQEKLCDALPEFVKVDLKRISDLNTSISMLLEKGPDGIDIEQVKYRLKTLKAIRDEIISKFTKTINVKSITVNFEVDPSEVTQPITLLRFNKNKGFNRVYDKNLHNSNIKITDKILFHSNEITEKDGSVDLHLVYLNKLVSSTISTTVSDSEDTNATSGSFYYRIPAQAKFKVMVAGVNKGEATLAVPQEGVTVSAPSKLRNITFKLHPGLGSIYSVSGKTSEAKFGEMDSLRKTIFTDKNEKSIKELENKIKIRDLKKELEGETDDSSEDSN